MRFALETASNDIAFALTSLAREKLSNQSNQEEENISVTTNLLEEKSWPERNDAVFGRAETKYGS
uniref:Uncharacterized protein n=1 Tax=Romanomermis culicivorax TaxID=13658 RepID=A0A915KUQ8_ROMCU